MSGGRPAMFQFMGLTVASPDAVSFLDLGSGVGKQLGGWSNEGSDREHMLHDVRATRTTCSFPP